MSAQPPVVPRKPSGIRVMIPTGHQPPHSVLPIHTDYGGENHASHVSNHTSLVNAQREVEILNHCFDDVERFMSRLQQTAEAQGILNQRKKKGSKKSKTKEGQDDDLLILKASPPSEGEFVDIFQKLKYSFCLLDRLKSSIAQPDAAELLHPIFLPLRLMVKTTGGPVLGASVVSPAMTSGAVSLLHKHLAEEEKELWISLGPNWTSPYSSLSGSVPPYTPVFLDGWQPQGHDAAGQPFVDPIESQHKQDAFRESTSAHDQVHRTTEVYGDGADEVEENSLPPEGERLFCCSYDFVARNSSELSVLQGETLEVIESSKRWWKCQNRFGEIGFVPFNILEPLSDLNNGGDRSVVHRESTKTAFSPRSKYFSYAPQSQAGFSPISPLRPQSMFLPSTAFPFQADGNDRVLIVNDELLEKLADRRASSRKAVPRTAETSAPLNYQSDPAEVEAWLTAKGFSQTTVQSLRVLTGAQLFSLTKDEFRTVCPEEGVRVYGQIMMQRSLLEDVHKATELEKVMEKQKLKMDLKSDTLEV